MLQQLKNQPVDAKELDKSKNQGISAFILGRATDQQFLRVTPADIQRVAREYFVPSDARCWWSSRPRRRKKSRHVECRAVFLRCCCPQGGDVIPQSK